jgi:hypothetical protein
VDFSTHGDLFQRVEVIGLQESFEMDSQGGSAHQDGPHGRTTSHQLTYRFLLRADLTPAEYAWPLVISVHSR